MKIINKGIRGIRKILEECLALLFVLNDWRVIWYAKTAVLLPLAYIDSPLDLIPDGLLFFGQIDALFVIRLSYTLLKTFVDPFVLEECRVRSREFLSHRGKHRMKFAVACSAIWIFLLTFVAVYLWKEIRRHRVP